MFLSFRRTTSCGAHRCKEQEPLISFRSKYPVLLASGTVIRSFCSGPTSETPSLAANPLPVTKITLGETRHSTTTLIKITGDSRRHKRLVRTT